MIDVIGTDAAGVAALPAPLQKLVHQAQLLAAPSRLLADLPTGTSAETVSTDRPDRVFEPLRQALAMGQPAVVLASGDPLWFGIGRLLLQQFPAKQLRFHPAPSSMQLAFARIGRPWQDATWVSLHGRDPEPLAALLQKRPAALAVLTEPG